MKIHTGKYWLLLAAICAAGTALAVTALLSARAMSTQPPQEIANTKRASDIFRWSVNQQSKLGPARLVVTTSTYEKGHSRSTEINRCSVTWNDRSHYKATATSTRYKSGVQIYVDGSRRISYDPAKKTYSTDLRGMRIPPFISATVDTAKIDLDSAAQMRLVDHAQVQYTLYHGEPSYKLTWKRPVVAVKMYFGIKTMVVRKRDGLITKLHLVLPDGQYVVETASYTLETKPFPSVAFRFTPPFGSKKVG